MITPNDKLTLKIYEGPHGFVWAVYANEGTAPGSLLGAAGSMSAEQALKQGGAVLHNWMEHRDCPHEWEELDHYIQCGRCKIVDWERTRARVHDA